MARGKVIVLWTAQAYPRLPSEVRENVRTTNERNTMNGTEKKRNNATSKKRIDKTGLSGGAMAEIATQFRNKKLSIGQQPDAHICNIMKQTKLDKIKEWLAANADNPKMQRQVAAAKEQYENVFDESILQDILLIDKLNQLLHPPQKKPQQFKQASKRWQSHKEKTQLKRTHKAKRKQLFVDSFGREYQVPIN